MIARGIAGCGLCRYGTFCVGVCNRRIGYAPGVAGNFIGHIMFFALEQRLWLKLS